MSDLFKNHIVGFPTRRLIYLLITHFCLQISLQLSDLKGVLAKLFNELQNQKKRTKDGSLGVVFLGDKDTAAYLLTQLKFKIEETGTSMDDIYWVMPDLVGNDVSIFENLYNSAGNKTVVFSKCSTDLPSIEAYVRSKWQHIINNPDSHTDGLDALFACADKTVVPKWTNQHAESVGDAVYILASALQRQQRYYCSQVSGICQKLKKNFKLDSDLTTNPLNYSQLPASVTVPEFSTAERTVKLTADGEVEASTTKPLYELYMYTRYGSSNYSISKVSVRQVKFKPCLGVLLFSSLAQPTAHK